MKKIGFFLVMAVFVTPVRGDEHELSFTRKIAPAVGGLAVGGTTYAALQMYLEKKIPVSAAVAALSGLLSWLVFYKLRTKTHQEVLACSEKVLNKVEKDLNEIESKPEVAIALRYAGNVQDLMKEYTVLTSRQQQFPLIAAKELFVCCTARLNTDLELLKKIKVDDESRIKNCERCIGLRQEIEQCDAYIERIVLMQNAFQNILVDFKMQPLYFQQQTGSLVLDQSISLISIMFFSIIAATMYIQTPTPTPIIISRCF